MTASTNRVDKTKSNEQTEVTVQAEISKGAVVTMGVTGAVVLLWAFVSLASALVDTGGPVSLVKSWFGAAIGM